MAQLRRRCAQTAASSTPSPTTSTTARALLERAQCVLRALAEDKSAVGEAVFTPEDSGRISVPIRTERRATAVEKVGCTADGQKRPR